jgi:glycerate-2-kinase
MKNKLIEIFRESVQSVIPKNLFESNIRLNGDIIELFDTKIDTAKYNSIKVISVGKAAYPMTLALINILKDKIENGISVNLKKVLSPVKNIKIIYGSHPYPDEKSVNSAKEIINFINREIKGNELVFFLISGGASALMTLPANGINLEDMIKTTKTVMNTGANIKELNTIRKHLSAIKGGRIAEMIHPAKLITIAISDVQDDDLEDIGSCPTVPDPSTFQDCIDILNKYEIIDKIPEKVLSYFKKGVLGEIKESIKPNSEIFKDNKSYIIGNTLYALKKGEALFKKEGLKTMILTSNDCGEAKEIAKLYSAIIKETIKTGNPASPPLVFLTGGELTVNVKGTGKGGRNQELILAMLLELENLKNRFCILSGGTDGIDGPTDTAGAIIDNSIYNKIKELKIIPQDYLLNNDAYNFFKQTDSLIFTGPTDTNVRDIRFFYIGEKIE